MFQATAYILIGGKSERFGSVKWQTILDGKSILDRSWDTCSAFENRYVIGKKKPSNIGHSFIHDKLIIRAPINGLYTALEHTNTDWLLLLSCDLPLIIPNIFQQLWEASMDEFDAVIPLVNGRKQVTCALYHKRILKYVNQQISLNKFSLHEVVNSIKSCWVNMSKYEMEFTNMNSRKDYEMITKMIKQS